MGMAVNGNLAKGLGEPSLVRKKNKRRRDSLNKMNEDFRKELQMLIYRDPGRAMRGLSRGRGGVQVYYQEVKLYICYNN